MQGTLEEAATPSNPKTLQDVHENQLSFTSGSGIKVIEQNVNQLRPSLSTPGSGADVTVRIYFSTKVGIAEQIVKA